VSFLIRGEGELSSFWRRFSWGCVLEFAMAGSFIRGSVEIVISFLAGSDEYFLDYRF
jgi:hypothetical protein